MNNVYIDVGTIADLASVTTCQIRRVIGHRAELHPNGFYCAQYWISDLLDLTVVKFGLTTPVQS